MNKRRVVVTGMGALTPIGNTVETYWQSLVAGVSGADQITHFDATNFKTHFACQLKNSQVEEVLGLRLMRRLDPFIQYALVVSDEAVKDSGLAEVADKSEFGVMFTSGIGGLTSLEDEVAKFATGNGVPRYTPSLVPRMIVDAAAGNISIRHGFQGISCAVVTACASSTHSMGLALDQIRMGRNKVVLVGGAEAPICHVGVGAFNALRALSTRNDSPATASRPYAKDRDGFVLGEGAAALIFEDLEHALARGAKIYAEVVGAGITADAYHQTDPHPDGEGAMRAMLLALRDAGMTTADIDYINAHSTSTPVGDAMEVKAIVSTFKEDVYRLNISSTKSMTGHLLGAAGAIEAVACVMSVKDDVVPPTINLNEVDPEFDPNLNFTPNVAQRRTVRAALSNNFGFGGHNSSIIFKKYEG